MPRERFVAERGESALQPERDAGPIEQNRRLESLALQSRGLKHVDEANGSFERHRMERDERLLARLGLHVFEHLLLVVDQEVAFLVCGLVDCGHA
ncbi:hypothetical protein D3C81_1019460 [compost metagenome]